MRWALASASAYWGVISDAHAEEVVATVNRLEDLASVRKLMELLRGATQKAQAA